MGWGITPLTRGWSLPLRHGMDPFEDEPHPRFHTVDGFQAQGYSALNKGGKWKQIRGFLTTPQPLDSWMWICTSIVLPDLFEVGPR